MKKRHNNNNRRRLPREAMLTRDRAVWAMHLKGYSPTEAADELGLPRSTVQRSLERSEKLRADAEALGAPQHLLDMLDNPDLIDDPAEIKCVADCERLSPLGAHRYRYLPADSPVRAIIAEWTPSAEWRARVYPEPEPVTGRIYSDYGESWRERTEAAVSGRQRTDPGDETDGNESASWRAGFSGWSLAELSVLDRYRIRAL